MTKHAPALLAFWSKNQNRFLALTKAEADARSGGAFGMSRIMLMDAGAVISKEVYSTATYSLTEAGQNAVRRLLAT